MVLDVILKNLTPTAAGILVFGILWIMGEEGGALIVLGVTVLLQILWLILVGGAGRR